ncbi:hypothetical protein NQ117_08590 [Paenibacillus sp. SC116]|uniref:hypothetical protein n=1 Tax=Paenibacillus sp. SC116 TaxID=2968986 RepID=UPI00215AA09F|nr:hypothetical protein [Paenibacillus sp. SC116]MCR8843743.1 hypothetical protein [Paenibacillus sp. SC116]
MPDVISIEDIILSYLIDEDTYIQPHSMESLEYPFEIKSNDYLSYAKNDLISSDDKTNANVNALSNAKRAIESRVDSILQIYGIKRVGQRVKDLNSFPQKLDLLRELGLIAPNIMKKINTARNRMEHAYIDPSTGSLDDIVDFIDIAELFLESTEVIVTRFINQFILESDSIEDYWLFCKYDFEQASFEIEVNYNDTNAVERHNLQFNRKRKEYNHTFNRLFNLVYKVTLNPPYKH